MSPYQCNGQEEENEENTKEGWREANRVKEHMII